MVHGTLFDARLLEQLERGAIGDEEFFEAFCRKTGVRPDRAATVRAASDIFQLRTEMVPLVSGLHRAGHRLGILSNTSQMHWDHCRRRYDVLKLFELPALSYRLQVAKPDAAIYLAATEMARVAPEEVFFTDDLAKHVDGARAFGWDAVLFTSVAQLSAELAQRGVYWSA